MSCSPFDLRDYFLKELPAAEGRQVEGHLRSCQACREELDRLRIAEAALLALRDEEIPQRIAFVSDKVFEPSGWRRWAAMFWGSAARLGFASAAMLSAAIVFAALSRPAPMMVSLAAPSAPAVAPVAAERNVDQQVRAAVMQATAEVETRQSAQLARTVAEMEKRHELDRTGLIMAMEKHVDYLQKRLNQYVVAVNGYGPPREAPGVSQ